jgi:dihydroorotase
MKTTLTLVRPDDWHVHLRDGAALATTAPHCATRFARAIVMPNLDPPVVDCAQARAYRDRILAHVPEGTRFEPLMTLYLTDRTAPDEIRRAAGESVIAAAKLYPAGATTNSERGVTAIERILPVLDVMQTHGLPLLVHGEVTTEQVDIFDREARFIDEVLEPLVRRFPALRIVFEHITTRAAVEYVDGAPATIAATITPHHLLFNRNALLAGGVRPHYYCLPVLKREEDRAALLGAATGGSPKYFLGTDSAPHARGRKETACGCAGIYSAHAAIELYAEAFEQAGALDRLEGFASFHGPDFYKLPRNTDRITLHREPWTPPAHYALGEDPLIPLRAGEPVAWRLVSSGEYREN